MYWTSEKQCAMKKYVNRDSEKNKKQNKTNKMKNIGAGVGVSPTPENEKYEKAMCKECKKMDG